MKDLLDQNLIEHNIFVPNNVEFSPFEAIDQIKNILESTMRDDDVKIYSRSTLRKSLELVGDVDRIQQVLLNLSTNARKYVSKKDGPWRR